MQLNILKYFLLALVLVSFAVKAKAEPIPVSLHSNRSAILETELQADDGGMLDWFGSAVSFSGNQVIVGAEGFDRFDGVNLIPQTGAAYIFELDGNNWIQADQLLVDASQEITLGDRLGHAVSLQGNRAAISAVADRVGGHEAGSVYIFEFNGSAWIQSHKLTASDIDHSIAFGTSICLDQDRLLIGDSFNNSNGTESGAAYLFEFNGNNWFETQKLLVGDNQPFDHYGQAVSLQGDRAVIGAPRKDNTSGNNDEGKVYVFDFDGTDWIETAVLTPEDGSYDGYFGAAVSFSGNRIVVGAYADDNDLSLNATGSVYVFEYAGNSWEQTVELTASDSLNGDFFGASVKLQNNRLLVGASRDDHDDAVFQEDKGAAYLFEYDGSQWVQIERIVSGNSGVGDYFGQVVDMQGDRVLIGDGKTINHPDPRSAYVFQIGDLADLIFKDGFE